MSKTSVDFPVEWEWPLTLSDQLAIQALPSEARAAVERYIRSRVTVLADDPENDEYVRGWKDGVEAMRDEVAMACEPQPPHRRDRK